MTTKNETSVEVVSIYSQKYINIVNYIYEGYKKLNLKDESLFIIDELYTYPKMKNCEQNSFCLFAYVNKKFLGLVCVFFDKNIIENGFIIQSMIKSPDFYHDRSIRLNSVLIPYLSKYINAQYIYVNPFERQSNILYKYYNIKYVMDNNELIVKYPPTEEGDPPIVEICGRRFTLEMYLKLY